MTVRRIHFIGIGGVGMAGLAVLLRACGHAVTGCDLKPTPRTRWLEKLGIGMSYGHSPEHLKDVDEVIVTPAVPKDEPECAQAVRQAEAGLLRLRFRGEALAELVNGREGIAVCGSHGKTTTSTWTAKLLRALGEDAAWCIGGETAAFPVAGTGSGPLVVEADESDGTLALYRAKTLVVTNCEYDHADHFRSVADYVACYETAKRQARDVIEGESRGPLDGFSDLPCIAALPSHNRRNARTAVEVALRRGHRLADIFRALPDIVAELPDRRFQRVADGVYTDYAHHPTEMACAVLMARQVCKGRLRVLFQPHRFSRTKALLDRFPGSFEGADEVVLCPTYAAFEKPVEGGDIADLYAACRAAFAVGKRIDLRLARSCEEAWEHARNSMEDEDLTLLLGAGDIVRLLPKVRSDLDAPVARALRRIWIGAGSNTWKSDLRLNVEYVRTEGPANAPGATLGIPWMAGIPGTIGGWVKMNAGAFGHSISEVLEAVKVDGRWIPAADCGFAYRRSDITGEIQDVRLIPDISSLAADSASSYLARRPRFPSGTFGSFFKNPEGDHAGRLLEEAGAKGLRVGGAFVWSRHANVIVRGEGATASDVLALARLMRNRVLFRFGIALEPEVQGIEF